MYELSSDGWTSLRKKHNLTQSQMAEELDVTRNMVQKLEDGSSLGSLKIVFKAVLRFGNNFEITPDTLKKLHPKVKL